MNFQEAGLTITKQLAEALGRISEKEIEDFCNRLLRAKVIFITGEGRSGLVGRCFAMRLMHLGLRIHFVGEATTPALGPSDLLVAISGSGETALTQTIARLARQAGGDVVVITSARESPISMLADMSLIVPADFEDNIQFGRSLFEQGALITLDVIALLLQQKLAQTKGQMEARHANLE